MGKDLNLIVAYDKNKLIGDGNRLPWKIEEDLQYFKDKTLGNVIIMGRKTYESLPKKLKGRDIVILTRDENYEVEDKSVRVLISVEEVLFYINFVLNKEVFIIGGSETYKQFLPFVNKLFITEIHSEFKGDVHFPEWDKSLYEEVSRINNKKDDLHYDFVEYLKK